MLRMTSCTLAAFSLLSVSCTRVSPAAKPAAHSRPDWSVPSVDPRPAKTSFYAADEALRDVLSSPLVYLGTGPWPGNGRMVACVFRNEHVLVVSAYCGITETQAFRLDVYSPSRGRTRIYAESNTPLSGHMRQQYFSFMVEGEPSPGPESSLPTVDLAMSFAELSAYEEQRYNAFLPACFAGIEHMTERSGCLGPLSPQASTWTARNKPFVDQANSDWYRIVRELRIQATQHGKDPD